MKRKATIGLIVVFGWLVLVGIFSEGPSERTQMIKQDSNMSSTLEQAPQPDPNCEDESNILQGSRFSGSDWNRYESGDNVSGCWVLNLAPGCYDVSMSVAAVEGFHFEQGDQVITPSWSGEGGLEEKPPGDYIYCFKYQPVFRVNSKPSGDGWLLKLRVRDKGTPIPPPPLTPKRIVETCTDFWNGEVIVLLDWLKTQKANVDGEGGTRFDGDKLYDEDKNGVPEAMVRFSYWYTNYFGGTIKGTSIAYIEEGTSPFNCRLVKHLYIQ